MYKKQMKFQKLICYIELLASALVFAYSLGIMTDLYDSLYVMIPDPTDLSMTYVEGAAIYYEMQPFNQLLTKVGIILILLAAFMLVMNTHVRRRYYAGNFFAIGVMTVASVSASVWGLMNVLKYKTQYVTTIDFESLKMWADVWGTPYYDASHTFWFDVSYVVFGILLISTALLVFNMIWKIKLTKAEKKLISEGKEAA